MDDTNTQLNTAFVQGVISDYFKGGAFKDKKITDTPTEDLMITNKRYVDGLATSVYGRMYLTAIQNVGNATNVKILLDTVSFSSGITADTTNNRFTALTDGYYFAAGEILYSSPTDGGYMAAMVYVNGFETAHCVYVAKTTGDQGVQVSDLFHLAVGEYAELYTRDDNGAAKNINPGSAFTYFNIFKI